MAVAFLNMPGTIRTPGQFAEVNPGISPYMGISKTVLIGRMLSTGSAAVGKPIILGGSNPNGLFGKGSMLADMAVFARNFNQTGAVYGLPVADPVGGIAAVGTITLGGPATDSGTLSRYIAGERYDTTVAYGDTAATIAINMAAAINDGYTKYNRSMLPPVVATAAAGVVTLTARHTGVEGNYVSILAGLDGDEVDPAGLTVTTVAMAGGAGIVNVAAALASLGATGFDWIASPYCTAEALADSKQFLSDSGSGRWSPTVGLDGHYITASRGNLSTLTALGAVHNDRHATILGLNGVPHPGWSWIAAVAGVIGYSKNIGRALTEAVEIARPLQTLELDGLRPPADPADQWALSDREALLENGISTFTFAVDGTPVIDRVITTYETDSYGDIDISFLGIEPIAIAMYVKRYMKQQLAARYPRQVLRDDNPLNVQGVATVAQIRATIIHTYTQLSRVACLVENVALFSKYLIVERSSDPSRVNAYLPIDVANQLIALASNITVFAQLTDDNATLL